MPSLEFFLVAQSVSIDQGTNLISILEVMEEVAGPNPPVIPSLAIVAAWNIEPDDMSRQFAVSVRLQYADGKRIDFPSVEFTAQNARQRTVIRIGMLPTAAFGDMKFELLLDGVHQANHRVTVRQLTQTERETPTINFRDGA